MKIIEFKAAYGDATKNVKLTEHFGSGNGYHLYVDDYYQGQFVIRKGKWEWLNANTSLEQQDILDIIERLEQL